MGAGVGPAAHQRRMAVHDVLAEIELGGEERLPDPEEIVRQLLRIVRPGRKPAWT